MFRKLEELLESGTLDRDVAEAIDTEITKAHTGLKDERETLSKKNKELTSSFEEIMGAKTSLEAQLSDYDEKIKTAKDEGKGEVVKQLEAERQKQKELADNLKSFESENKKLKIANAVSKELGKYSVRKDLRSDAEVVLQSMVSIGDDGVIFGEGQTIEDGVKGYFETRKSYLESAGDGGGSGASGGQGGGKTTKGNFSGNSEERKSSIQNMIDADK